MGKGRRWGSDKRMISWETDFLGNNKRDKFTEYRRTKLQKATNKASRRRPKIVKSIFYQRKSKAAFSQQKQPQNLAKQGFN
jgi:hypothetical protein